MAREFYTPPAAVPSDIDTRLGHFSTWCCLPKGYTPPPFTIVQNENTGRVRIQFELTEFTQTCQCSIECTTSALVFQEDTETEVETQKGQFCPADEGFEVDLANVAFSDETPTEFLFNFTDSKGNISTVRVRSLVTVVPVSPMVVEQWTDGNRRRRIQIGVPLYSKGFYDLRDIATQYQVERYIGTPNNRELWIGWTSAGAGARTLIQRAKERVLWDRDVRKSTTYGYRVRFRSTFDHATPWSEWTTVS